MKNVKKQKNTADRLVTVCLLLAVLLSGCSFGPTGANREPEPTAAPTPVPTAAPTPDPEVLARQQRLSEAKDGFLWKDGALQTVDAEGNLRSDCYVGVLYFGKNGQYTSGNAELDALVSKIVAGHTDASMTRMEMLRAMYDYTRDNIDYLGLANYECSMLPAHGKDGWMPDLAIRALRDGKGNCYCFAAAFAALARGLGFQAYAVGGIVGANEEPHGWVDILDDSGKIWMNDPEIEYRMADYQRMIEGKDPIPDLFYKSEDMIGGETGLAYVAGYNPFRAEKEEAEARNLQPSGTPESAGTDLQPAGTDLRPVGDGVTR